MHKKFHIPIVIFIPLINHPLYSTYNYVQYGLVFFTAIEKRWNSQQLYKWVGVVIAQWWILQIYHDENKLHFDVCFVQDQHT